MKTCKKCNKDFEVTDEDRKYYDEISPVFNGKKYAIPEPTLCPDCRQQRRLIWRNEFTLYKRKCDATGKDIISVYSADKTFPVYNNKYWHSDEWNALEYGQDFDFGPKVRPFFEQFEELMNKVPQLARSAVGNQNCDYVNQCGWCKNCYLIFEADFNENCHYSTHIYDSKSCIDIDHGTKCELCYECINCQNCYNLKFSQNCQNCSDSSFLKNCIGCKNCFGSVNLRNKEFYFFNEKYTEEEYLKKISSLNLKTVKGIEDAGIKFQEFAKKFPNKYMIGTQNEDSTGDYLSNTQRCQNCYDVNNAQDCKFAFDSRYIKKVYDITVFGSHKGAEFCYENHEIGDGVKNIYFSDQIWTGSYNVFYSKLCINNSHDVFGCVGLKHAQYCILNKQYTKEEYEELVPRIIEHMKKTGEWGEFLPAEISPFGYNETLAPESHPLEKEEALSKGYKWIDPDKREYQPQTYIIPEHISDVPDSIVNDLLACEDCGRNYKIIEQELEFYRDQGLPIPKKCFYCRHKARFDMRNPRKLWDRKCDKCSVPIKTSYAPERPEKVYCEPCYLECLE